MTPHEVAPGVFATLPIDPEHVADAMDSGIKFAPDHRPRTLMRGRPNLCFINAAEFVALNRGYAYVEGFANRPGPHPWVHHAWAVRTGSLSVTEVTWAQPARAYRGVPLIGTNEGARFLPGLYACNLGSCEALLRRSATAQPTGPPRRVPGWPA